MEEDIYDWRMLNKVSTLDMPNLTHIVNVV